MWNKGNNNNNNNQRFNGPSVRDFFNRNFFQNFNQNPWLNFNGNPGQNFNGNLGQNFNGNPRQNFNGNPRQNFNGNPIQNFQGNPRQNFQSNNFIRPPNMNGNNAYRQPTPNLLHLLQTPNNNTRNVIASYLPNCKQSTNRNKKTKLTKTVSNNIISQTEDEPSTTKINQSHSSPKSTTNVSVGEHPDKEDINANEDSNLSQIPNTSTTAESLTHPSSIIIKDCPSVSILTTESSIAKEVDNPYIIPSQDPSSTSPVQSDQLCLNTDKDGIICSKTSTVAEKDLISGDSTNSWTGFTEPSSSTTQSLSKQPTDEIQKTNTNSTLPSNNLTNNIDSSYSNETFNFDSTSNIASTSTSSICTKGSDNSSCISKESNMLNPSKPPLSVSSMTNATASLVDEIDVSAPLGNETSVFTKPFSNESMETTKLSSSKDADPNKVSVDLFVLPEKSPNGMQSSTNIVTKPALSQISDNTVVSEGNDKTTITKDSTEILKSSFVNDDSIKASIVVAVSPVRSPNSVLPLKSILKKSTLDSSTNTSTRTLASMSDNTLDSEGNVKEIFTKNSEETSKSSFPKDNDSNKATTDLSVLPDKSSNSVMSKIVETKSALYPSINKSISTVLLTSDNTTISKVNNVTTFTKNSNHTIESSFVKTDDLNDESIVSSLPLDKSRNSLLPSENIVTKSTLNSTNTSTIKAMSTSNNSSASEGNNMENFTKILPETSKSSFEKNHDQINASIDFSVLPDKGSNSELPSKISIKKSTLYPTPNTSINSALSTSDSDSEGKFVEPITKNSIETLKSNDLSLLPDKSQNSILPSCITVTESALYPLEDKQLTTSDQTLVSEGDFSKNVYSILFDDDENALENKNESNDNARKLSLDVLTPARLKQGTNCIQPHSKEKLPSLRTQANDSVASSLNKNNKISVLINPTNQTETSKENLTVVNSSVAVSSEYSDSSDSKSLSLNSNITKDCLVSPAAILVSNSSISTSNSNSKESILDSVVKNTFPSFVSKEVPIKSAETNLVPKKAVGKSGLVLSRISKAKSILRSKLFQDKLLSQKSITETEKSAEVKSLDFKKRILKSKNLLNDINEKNKKAKTENENPDEDYGDYYGCALPGHNALEIVTPFQKEKKKNMKSKEDNDSILAMISKITDPSKSISKEKSISPNRSEGSKKSDKKDQSHSKKKSSSRVRSRSKSPSKKTGRNSKSSYSRKKSKSRSRSNSRSKSSRKSSSRRSRKSSRSRSRSSSRTDSKSLSPKSRRLDKKSSHSPNKNYASSIRKGHRNKGTDSDDNRNNRRSQKRKEDRLKKREKEPKNVCGVQILTKDPVKHDILEMQILRIDSLFMHGNDKDINDKIKEGDDSSTLGTEKNRNSRIDVYDSENEVDPWETMGYGWTTVESDDEKEAKTKDSKKSNGKEESLKPKYDKNGSLTNRDAIIRNTEKRTSNCDTGRKRKSSVTSEDSIRDTKKIKNNDDIERNRKSSERSEDNIIDRERRKSNSDSERKSKSSDKNEDCISDTDRRKGRYETERRKNSSDESEDEFGKDKVRSKSIESRSSSSSENTIDISSDSEEDIEEKEKIIKKKKSKCKRRSSISSDSNSGTREFNDKSTNKKKKAKKKRKRKSKKSEKNKRSKKKKASKSENKSKTSPSYPSSEDETTVMNKRQDQDINCSNIPERHINKFIDRPQHQQDAEEVYKENLDQNFETEPSNSCDMSVNDAMKIYLEKMNKNNEKTVLEKNSDVPLASKSKDNLGSNTSVIQKEEEQIQESVDEIFNQRHSMKKHIELAQEVVELRKLVKLYEDRVQGKFAVENAMGKFAVENSMQQNPSYDEGTLARISQSRHVDNLREEQMKRGINHRQFDEDTNVNIKGQPAENKKSQENVWGAAYVAQVEKDVINEKSALNHIATKIVDKPNQNYEYYEKNTNLHHSHLSISTDRSFHETIVHEYEGEPRLLGDECQIRNSSSVKKMENVVFGEQLDIMLRDARLNSTEQYDSSNTDVGVNVQPKEIPERMDPRITKYSECRISNVYNDSSSPASPDANEINTNNGNGNIPNKGIRGSTTGVKAVNPVTEQRNLLTESVDPRLYNKSLFKYQNENDIANEKPADPRLYNKSLYMNYREDDISKESRKDRTKNWVTEQKAVDIERKTMKYDRNIQQTFCDEIVNDLGKESVIGSQTELKDSFEIQPVKDKAYRPYEKIAGIKYKKKDHKKIENRSQYIEHDKDNEDKIKNIRINVKEGISKNKGQEDKTIINTNNLNIITNTSGEIENMNKISLQSTTQDTNVASTITREPIYENNNLIPLQTISGEENLSLNKNPNLDSDYHSNRVTETTSLKITTSKDKSNIIVDEKNIKKTLHSEQISEKILSCSSENSFEVKIYNSERDSSNVSLLKDALPLKNQKNLNHVENSYNKVKSISEDNIYNTNNLNSFEKSQNIDKTTQEEKNSNINKNSRYLCTLKSVPLQTPEKLNSADKSQNKSKAISEEKGNDSNTNSHDVVTSVESLPLQTPEKLNSAAKSQNKSKAISEEKGNYSNTNSHDVVTSVESLPLQTTENINSSKKFKNERNFTKNLKMRNLQRKNEHKENPKHVANNVCLDKEKDKSMQNIPVVENVNVTIVNSKVDLSCNSKYKSKSDISNVNTTKNKTSIEDKAFQLIDDNSIAPSESTSKRLMNHKKHAKTVESLGALRNDKNSKNFTERTTILLKKSYRRIGVVKLYHLTNFCPNCMSELIPDINTRVKLSTATLILKCQVCYQEIMMIGVVAPFANSKREEPSRNIAKHSNSLNDSSNKGFKNSYVNNTHNDQNLTQLDNTSEYSRKEPVHVELKSKSKTKLKALKSDKMSSKKKSIDFKIVENSTNIVVGKRVKPSKPKICQNKMEELSKNRRRNKNENVHLHNENQIQDVININSISNKPTKIRLRVKVKAINDDNVKKIVEIMGQKTKLKAKSKKLTATKIKKMKNGDKKTIMKKKHKGTVLGLPKTNYFKKEKNIFTKKVGSFMQNKQDNQMNKIPVESNNIYETSFKTNADNQNIDTEKFVEIKMEKHSYPENITSENTDTKETIFENDHFVALQTKADSNDSSFTCHDNIATNSATDQCAKENNVSVIKTNNLVADLLLQIPENVKSNEKSNTSIIENDVVNDKHEIQGTKDTVSSTSEDCGITTDIFDRIEQSTELKMQTSKINEKISDINISNEAINSKKDLVVDPLSKLENLSAGKKVRKITSKLKFDDIYTMCKQCNTGFIEQGKYEEHIKKCSPSKNKSKNTSTKNKSQYVKAGVYVCKICKSGIIGTTAYENHLKTHV